MPLFGLYPLWKRHRYHFFLLLAIFGLVSAGFILILNFNLDKLSLWVNNVFWIPAYMIAAILMGCAVDWTSSQHVKGLNLRIPATLLGLASVLLPLTANYYRSDKSNSSLPKIGREDPNAEAPRGHRNAEEYTCVSVSRAA